MKKKLFIKTYGCQMNVYDSNRMADVMKPHGYETVESPDEADLVVLNTCHIREKAAEKVYSDVGRIRMIKEERAAAGGSEMTIAVAGCVAQAEGAEMMKRAPVIDLVLGPQTYHRLPELVRTAEAGRKNGKPAHVLDTEFPAESKFDFLPEESDLQGPAAFLAVQEGCDKFCTFCVVPYTRGAEYSRPMMDLMTEAKRLVSKGVRDITLLGQNVNAYHGDDGKGGTASLGGLIRALADIDGLARIRYTTSHPRDMDDELISAHRDVVACMPYLHLPVQSGSDRILAAMNRKHTAESYLDIIRRLRDARPDLALSSDFIVGFPGEKDEDFEATMALVREVGYAQSFSFKYSARPGTPASVMPFQVPEDVKSERLAALQALLAEQQLAFNKACLGKTLEVLVERPGKKDGEVVGRSPYLQAVHIDVTGSDYTLDEGSVPTYSDLMGQMVRVEIRDAGPGNLRGVIAA
ncbi:tRNA (N6-isopentenyl adenosine(37)-C2)-methylthiotransferase MiaB [Pseudokordiimonas caeni]|uniref:tRNA (N6-isopentenyl adenosine(37)-C2)-methylthiotransferase MiaB n=1 Tax=Pseudokordiimonas caeni TaxID=2997908 RepID=UPI0028125180|nr:tRNA (N6-isopentenyl adenosine(37)-C2)-methylthiotransferase MiaB [Pseudokordiimonas caeni]